MRLVLKLQRTIHAKDTRFQRPNFAMSNFFVATYFLLTSLFHAILSILFDLNNFFGIGMVIAL